MTYGVVDLFCGVGGLTCGLEEAGLDVVAGYDLDLCGFALWEWAPKLLSVSEAWKDDSYEICEKPVQEIIKRFYEHEAGTSLM